MTMAVSMAIYRACSWLNVLRWFVQEIVILRVRRGTRFEKLSDDYMSYALRREMQAFLKKGGAA